MQLPMTQQQQPDPRFYNQQYAMPLAPMQGAAIQFAGCTQQGAVMFNSVNTKLIAWSVLQTLLKIYREDTNLPAPTENVPTNSVVAAVGERTKRFQLSILALAKQVYEYTNKSNDSVTPFIAEKLVNPFLEYLNAEFPRYCAKIQVSPMNNEMSLDPMLAQNIHQLHALFSVVHVSFFPQTFNYTGMPLQQVMYFADGFMRAMLAQLFKLTADSRLENTDLFELIGKNGTVLAKLQAAAFIQDKMQDALFLEISMISNKLVDMLRKVAIACYNNIAAIVPSLHTNARFRDGLEALYYSQKAF